MSSGDTSGAIAPAVDKAAEPSPSNAMPFDQQSTGPADLMVEVDGPGMEPNEIDPLPLLMLTEAYIDMAQRIAKSQDIDLRFAGLSVINKCTAVRTLANENDLLQQVVVLGDDYLRGISAPFGVKGGVSRVREALLLFPEGVRAGVRAGGRYIPFVKPEEPQATRPWARTVLWVRPIELGGRKDHVVLESRSEAGLFTLKISLKKARELGPYLKSPVRAELSVLRDAEGRIKDGEFVGFSLPEIEPGQATAAWQQWVSASVDTSATKNHLEQMVDD